MRHDQQREELDVFHLFAALAPCGIDLDSIESRTPPEPDILCTSEGAQLAFELVEIVDQAVVHRMKKQWEGMDWLRDGYEQAEPALKHALDQTLRNALVNVAFPDVMTSRQRARLIPLVLRALAEIPTGFTGNWILPAASPLAGTVGRVRVLRGEFNGPVFHVEAGGVTKDPTVERLRAKWNKTYETPSPIELLAYFWDSPSPIEWWLPRVQSFLAERMNSGPFRRVWFFDVAKLTIPYSATRDAPTL